MATAQLICFFISGFLISRLVIKTLLPQRMVYTLIGKKHLSISRVILYLVAISAGLSFFIPNAITVLTLLPVLELLRRTYADAEVPAGSIPTMLALSTIYGANIGGMGSITATPANGILVSYAELYSVPGEKFLTFAAWLVWGVPLVCILIVIPWLVLITIFRPWRYQLGKTRLPFSEADVIHPQQKTAIAVTAFFFISSLILSLLLMEYPQWALQTVVATVVVTLLMIGMLFLYPMVSTEETAKKVPLLQIADCYNDLPTRGFFFVGIAVVLAGILYFFNIDDLFAEWIKRWLPTGISFFTLFLLLALLTSFSTEVLSNTAVQISMFLIVLPFAESMGFPAVLALVIVTLSSTCAFMSPIATGVNGLAFGGVKDVSFAKMLLVVMVMNTLGAIVITIWATQVIARVFGL